MRKQVLVSVDRGETRVALMEMTGTPPAKARSTRAAKKPPAKAKDDWQVAELYFERRGSRSIVA